MQKCMEGWLKLKNNEAGGSGKFIYLAGEMEGIPYIKMCLELWDD